VLIPQLFWSQLCYSGLNSGISFLDEIFRFAARSTLHTSGTFFYHTRGLALLFFTTTAFFLGAAMEDFACACSHCMPLALFFITRVAWRCFFFVATAFFAWRCFFVLARCLPLLSSPCPLLYINIMRLLSA
jgi:hypothetical protein